jgi:predicted 2-oxoglutarate/Fe(II)-dependent dioxygenase YbiX
MLLKDLALVIPKLVSAEDCNLFINEYQRRQIAAKVETSINSNTGKRQESTCHVVKLHKENNLYDVAIGYQEKALSAWLNHLDKFKSFHIPLLNDMLREPHQIRIIRYKKGESIQEHSDYDHFIHASVTLNLNDDYLGGDFSFFNGSYKLRLGLGDALVFPADPFWTHSIQPVTEGTRYSINSFILSCGFEERNEIVNNLTEKLKFRPRAYKLKKDN